MAGKRSAQALNGKQSFWPKIVLAKHPESLEKFNFASADLIPPRRSYHIFAALYK